MVSVLNLSGYILNPPSIACYYYNNSLASENTIEELEAGYIKVFTVRHNGKCPKSGTNI